MADAIRVEIVTPSGVVVARDSIEVTAPTVDGEIGILPGHLPILAAVRTGLFSIRPTGGQDAVRYAVAHGVFEVVGQKALLLTEKCIKKEDVDVVAVRARFKEVGEALQGWSGDTASDERTKLIEEEQWLAAQLELIGDPPQPTTRELTRFLAKEGPTEEAPIESDGDEPAE